MTVRDALVLAIGVRPVVRLIVMRFDIARQCAVMMVMPHRYRRLDMGQAMGI